MFLFDDIQNLDDQSTQEMLREVDQVLIVPAMKDAGAGVKNKIFANMSAYAREMFKKKLEDAAPFPAGEVEAARKNIVELVLRLNREGRVKLG